MTMVLTSVHNPVAAAAGFPAITAGWRVIRCAGHLKRNNTGMLTKPFFGYTFQNSKDVRNGTHWDYPTAGF